MKGGIHTELGRITHQYHRDPITGEYTRQGLPGTEFEDGAVYHWTSNGWRLVNQAGIDRLAALRESARHVALLTRLSA